MVGFDGQGNGTIILDHGGGITTRYLHMYASGFLIAVGQHVTAGQTIARVGSSGNSTGCHLHFETRTGGVPSDPVPFMAARGVILE
jgi:murein DD-endopeptidase MepM/ murein hydrolase activator NlpD